MRAKKDEAVKIPRFASDEEAFEWYESHEVTDHLEDTTEVKPNTIIYQDSMGFWYRSSDGVQVSPPKKQNYRLLRANMSEQVRIIREAPTKELFAITDEQRQKDDQPIINIEREDERTWTSSSLSYATTLN